MGYGEILMSFFVRLDSKPECWEDRLILYIGFLIEKNRRSSTIKSYISAIKAVLGRRRSLSFPRQISN